MNLFETHACWVGGAEVELFRTVLDAACSVLSLLTRVACN